MTTKYNAGIHHRRSIRLKHYNYRSEGFYFITICCKNKECLFGHIINQQMQLNDLGNYVKQCWENIPMFFPQVRIDEFVIMPNHLHGIIEIIEQVKGKCNLPLQLRATQLPQKGTSQTIGSIVRGFKAGVTSWARKNSEIFDVWQRNYYEHIIRDEKSYLQIYEYIQNNPILWEQDQLYVD
ncbi:TPA: transposase [Haemophilus influenzae]|jgi:uncharacterized protein HI_0554|uniref:Transposase n=2 Tax=Haemophilus TaxID=724 RepID=A0A2S9S7H6_HAEIF|nr:transposase [Haemophilus influenzae]AJO88633.1 Transposase [Haemophilus influenzae]AXP37491.1 transposase [Haemophilus influenzae]AXP39275.1 transposase [Haemophilus influenzae]AXP45464.1 transposase [Haemophilus influenzae]AXP59130.1 transposase [Haemophilus influenzae]